jgi:adenylosuccinate lyase
MKELPFMSTEKILMACVERGKSRQEMHEVVREHSLAAGLNVKENGKENDLLRRLAGDQRVPFSLAELEEMICDFSQFTGRAEQQTEDYLEEIVEPILDRYSELIDSTDASLNV